MEPISVTVTGHLTRDPHEFNTDRGGPGVSLWLAIPLMSGGREYSRYIKVVAWGNLAANVAASLHQNDRVTVRASDIRSEHWLDNEKNQRSCLAVTAQEICPSLLRDTAVMGSATRRQRAAAAEPTDSDPTAGEQADLRVLNGVTTSAA